MRSFLKGAGAFVAVCGVGLVSASAAGISWGTPEAGVVAAVDALLAFWAYVTYSDEG